MRSPAPPAAGEAFGIAGTPEPVWRAWPAWAGFDPLDPAGISRLVVVAPHPDDEVLGVGGLMSLVAGAELVALTDGEGSHPGSAVLTREDLAHRRRGESAAALAALGLGGVRVTRLGLPDGGLAALDPTRLAGAIGEALAPGDTCAVTWRQDGHPDHEAAGRAAALACRARGAKLLEFPVWAWHWARPADPRVPWASARRVPLDAGTRARKALALAEFRSQIHPLGPAPADRAILPPPILARFLREFEIVFDPGAGAGPAGAG